MARVIAVAAYGPFWCKTCRGYIVSRPVDFGPPRQVRWVDACGCRPELLLALADDAADRARREQAKGAAV